MTEIQWKKVFFVSLILLFGFGCAVFAEEGDQLNESVDIQIDEVIKKTVANDILMKEEKSDRAMMTEAILKGIEESLNEKRPYEKISYENQGTVPMRSFMEGDLIKIFDFGDGEWDKTYVSEFKLTSKEMIGEKVEVLTFRDGDSDGHGFLLVRPSFPVEVTHLIMKLSFWIQSNQTLNIRAFSQKAIDLDGTAERTFSTNVKVFPSEQGQVIHLGLQAVNFYPIEILGIEWQGDNAGDAVQITAPILREQFLIEYLDHKKDLTTRERAMYGLIQELRSDNSYYRYYLWDFEKDEPTILTNEDVYGYGVGLLEAKTFMYDKSGKLKFQEKRDREGFRFAVSERLREDLMHTKYFSPSLPNVPAQEVWHNLDGEEFLKVSNAYNERYEITGRTVYKKDEFGVWEMKDEYYDAAQTPIEYYDSVLNKTQ